MGMRVELKCPCGSAVVFDSGTFINGGGVPDAKGRVYLSEARADEWTAEHRRCVAMREVKVAEPKPASFDGDCG